MKYLPSLVIFLFIAGCTKDSSKSSGNNNAGPNVTSNTSQSYAQITRNGVTVKLARFDSYGSVDASHAMLLQAGSEMRITIYAVEGVPDGQSYSNFNVISTKPGNSSTGAFSAISGLYNEFINGATDMHYIQPTSSITVTSATSDAIVGTGVLHFDDGTTGDLVFHLKPR